MAGHQIREVTLLGFRTWLDETPGLFQRGEITMNNYISVAANDSINHDEEKEAFDIEISKQSKETWNTHSWHTYIRYANLMAVELP